MDTSGKGFYGHIIILDFRKPLCFMIYTKIEIMHIHTYLNQRRAFFMSDYKQWFPYALMIENVILNNSETLLIHGYFVQIIIHLPHLLQE